MVFPEEPGSINSPPDRANLNIPGGIAGTIPRSAVGRRLLRIIGRIRDSAKSIKAAMTPPMAGWTGAAIAVCILGTIIAAAFFTTTFLQDFTLQKLPAYVATVSLSIAAGFGVILAATLVMKIPVPYRYALALFAPFILMYTFPGGAPHSLIAGVVLILLFSLMGGAYAALQRGGFSFPYQKIAFSVLALGVLGVMAGLYAIFSAKDIANPILEDYVLEDRTLDLPNPGLPGDYEVLTLTYGSGKDLRRPEYGDEVDIVSRRVDGSKLIDNWDGLAGWLRSSYWGFGVDELPLQARVWYPDGDGPFPLVLIVHGNHSMEDFSDPGYDYLGELFASRGIILASVDENFINFTRSAWVNVFENQPGLREENDARGWLLLEHLALWRDWNNEEGHRFSGKVDTERFALIGHSRGGEAVGIAASFNALDRYPDDATVDFDFGFNLRGVIAIAPVYGQYEPRDRPTPVRDVNYFTIHGDMDGDVQTFEGVAQYSRTMFSGEEHRFRSSLYVLGANHGQFNTTWNNVDVGLFRAWALDLDGIMDGEAQRDVARVYFSAFLEVVLYDRKEYLPMFRDARYAADWLPDTFYISQYADTDDTVITDFEEDIDPSTMRIPGGRITTANLSKWFEVANELKYVELDTHSLVVAWDGRFSEEPARVQFELPTPIGAETLVMSLSAYDTGTLPDDFEKEGGDDPDSEDFSDDESRNPEPLDWTIVLTDSNGQTAALPLSTDSGLYPLINAIPWRAGFLDSTAPSEVLFRRFELPLAEFVFANPDFDRMAIAEISFVFDRSGKGAIIIDDLLVTRAQ